MNYSDMVVNITTAYDLKGTAFSSDYVLEHCLAFISDKMFYNAVIVLSVILLTPIIKKLGYVYIRVNHDQLSEKKVKFLYDFFDNLWIIDYTVMAGYCLWVIALYLRF